MKLTSPTRTVPGIARMPERQNRWFLILCIQNPFLPTSGLGHHCAKAGSATLITRGASALFPIVHPKANIWNASRHRTSQRGGYRRRRILGPMGRCAEGFSDRSWIAKQAHAMIFGERHKHIYCLRQSLAIVGQITLLRDREIQSVEQFLSEQGKNPRRHAAGPAASRKLSSFAMVRSGGFGSSSFKLRGERIRQAPHSSGLELLLLRIRVEFVYPPRRMPQDLVRSACPTGRKRLVKRREASLTISGCWQPARLREISARLCTPLCKSVEQSRPARDVGIAPSTANHWLSMLE